MSYSYADIRGASNEFVMEQIRLHSHKHKELTEGEISRLEGIHNILFHSWVGTPVLRSDRDFLVGMYHKIT